MFPNSYFLLFFLAILRSRVRGGLSPELQRDCLQNNQQRIDAIAELPDVDTSLIPKSVRDADGEDPTAKIVGFLKASTQSLQAPVVSGIQALNPGLGIQTYWVANRIAVDNVSCTFASSLSLMPGVMSVRRQAISRLDSVGPASVQGTEQTNAFSQDEPQWGVVKIGANLIWNQTKGEGIVVANVDSGVLGTHEALRGNYRGGDFGWLDGFTDTTSEVPNDGNGHGTHTMGTIAGQNGIGVAPESTWIACKGCNAQGKCAEQPLLKCGQWIMCPYKMVGGTKTEDCSKRPKLVSNSWGLSLSNNWYNTVIQRWQEVGIVPLFSIGNSGPTCGSAGSPGDQNDVISVGATDKDDKVASFSSRGPSQATRKIKPEISAPGVSIVSAWNKDDSSYAALDGTSMATPHAAGVVALLLAKNPNLKYQDIYNALYNTTVKPTGATNYQMCGKCWFFDFSCYFKEATFPNNGYGNGRIDALAAYNSV